MAQYCTLMPHIKTQDGKFEESKLYKDLLSLTSRDRVITNRVYALLTDESFKERNSQNLQLDILGEPILSSVLQNSEVKKFLNEETVTSGILSSIGGKTKKGIIYKENTSANYEELSKRATDFNNSSPYNKNYVVTVEQNQEGLYLAVNKPTDENTTKARQIATNLALNSRIRTILSNSGVSIGVLNRLQEREKLNGIVDYQNAIYTSEGIIGLIKLAEGVRGEQALPEEFAHLAIDLAKDDPMVKRLFSILGNDDVLRQVFKEDFDKYNKDYEEDRERLIREAAGKLVYDSWFLQANPVPKYKSFLTRVIDSIKSFIKGTLNKDSFNNAIAETQKLADSIGTRILENNKLSPIQSQQISKLSSLKSIENAAKSKKQLLEDSIYNSLKKYSFYTKLLSSKIQKEEVPEKKAKLQDKLNEYQLQASEKLSLMKTLFDSEKYDEGLQNFIIDSSKEMESIQKRLSYIKGGVSVQEAAYNLKHISNFIESINAIAKDLNTSLQYEDTDLRITEDSKRLLSSLIESIETVRGQYILECQKTFASYLQQFFPKEGISATSNGKSKTLTRDDILSLLKTAESDTDILDTFIQSAANSNDIIIRLADKAMKASKEAKRQRVLEVRNKLFAAAKELKDSGDSDEILFEKHADGTLSDRYKSSINWTAYFDARDEFIKNLKEKYKDSNNGKEYRRELNAWRRQNEDVFGYPNAKYSVDPTKGMTEAQKKYYNTFMEIREEMMGYLPLEVLKSDPMRAIQISKELWERLKDSSVDTWGKQILDNAKDSFIVKTDDSSFGYTKASRGFNGEEQLSVPIFFINRIDSVDKLSRDTVSTMIAFADMAINYDEMSKVSNLFEIGKDVMEAREAGIQKFGNSAKETIDAFGIKAGKVISKSEGNNFVTRYNELLRTQLYGRYLRDEGVDLKDGERLSYNKTANVINRISALNQLAVNALAAIAAVGSDMINVNSEVFASFAKNGKSFFSAKQLWNADKIYRKEIPHVLGELGNPIKTSKLGLFIETFNVLHEYENKVRNEEWKKSKVRKLLSENSLYFLLQAGTHWGETRTALAQALNTKIKSDDGTREKSLWDILHVKYIDETDHSKGAVLEVEEGFTLSSEQKASFTRQAAGLNQRLYGIYSREDTNALQTTAVGQLVFLYRKFIIPSINRRYGKANYNFDLNTTNEGYYRSAFRFLRNLITDSKNFNRSISMYWDDMEDYQRSNCLRAVNELGTFVVLLALSSALKSLDWDDKKNPWAKRFLAYMSTRLKTETGAFSPIGVTGELWDILKSPMASINTVERMTDVLQVLVPWNWVGENAEVKQGRYKGKSKAYKAIMESPFVPMNRTVYRIFNPETGMIAFQ